MLFCCQFVNMLIICSEVKIHFVYLFTEQRLLKMTVERKIYVFGDFVFNVKALMENDFTEDVGRCCCPTQKQYITH